MTLANITTDTVNTQKIWFELSQGEGSKMYTLWRVTEGFQRYNRHFIQNLSTDKGQALEKTKSLIGDRDLIDDSRDSLRKIIRSDSGLIHFGKHHGEKVIDLPDGYLSWISQGGIINFVDERGNESSRELANTYQVELAKAEGIRRGILKEYKGRLLNNKYVERLEEQDRLNAKSSYFGTVGDKIELKVTFEKTTSFEGAYGTTYINNFRDDQGNIFIHFGSHIQGNLIRDEYFDVETLEIVRKTKDFICADIKDGKVFRVSLNNERIIENYKKEIESRNITCYYILPVSKTNKSVKFIEERRLENYRYEFEVGQKYILKASIKGHTEYQGTKQTQIIRPKLITIN